MIGATIAVTETPDLLRKGGGHPVTTVALWVLAGGIVLVFGAVVSFATVRGYAAAVR
jgi:hypothetical protein